MLTQKTTLTFIKENNNWSIVCDAWVDKKTAEFRATNVYFDESGKTVKYEKVQDFSNPLDDHTKHPLWSDPRKDLVMSEGFAELLEAASKDGKTAQIEFISYGWVSNTFSHYCLKSSDKTGADYEIRFGNEMPKQLRLTPVFRFILDSEYPDYIHLKK